MVSFTKIVASAFALSAAVALPVDEAATPKIQERNGVTGAMIAHKNNNYAVVVLTFLNMPAGTFNQAFEDWAPALRDQVNTNFMSWLYANDHTTWNFWTNMADGQWGDGLSQFATLLSGHEWVYEAKIRLSDASNLVMQSRIIDPMVAWLAAQNVQASVRILPQRRDDADEPIPATLSARGANTCPVNPPGNNIYQYATGDPKEIDMSQAVGWCK